VLTSQPTGDVTVRILPDDALSVPGGNVLTFTPADYNVDQTVTLHARADQVAQGLYTAYATLVATST
jgi:hypothetical protein